MPVKEQTFERFALSDPERRWELHKGQPREKPAMSVGHNRALYRLDRELLRQLNPDRFEVRVNSARARRGDETYYIPDLMVVPVDDVAALPNRPDVLEVYGQPLPLVVEIWSPSTGDYDIEGKLPEYQRRGDNEIWRLHPFDRVLTVWRRQPDGEYVESVYRGGIVEVASLPGVSIDLDALFV